MKLSFSPSSLTSVSKRSELHHRTAAGGVDDSKRKDGLEGFIAAPANPATGAEVNVGKAKYPPRTSTTPKATQEYLDSHAQRNLPRAEDTPTLDPFAQAAVFGARPPQTSSTLSLICYEDNALRALLRFRDEAHTFCPHFLGPEKADGRGLATFVGMFQPAEVSSACSCFETRTECCKLTATT